MRKETILNIFPSQDDVSRLVIAVEQEADHGSRLVLRQESFSDDVGWFVQSRVAVEPEQVAGLKMSLNSSPSGSTPARRRPHAARWSRVPSIVQFQDGAAGQVG